MSEKRSALNMDEQKMIQALKNAVKLTDEKIINRGDLNNLGKITSDMPVLVNLVAGMGTRFGVEPKCIQKVNGIPLARYSIDAFHRIFKSPSVCMVGYRYQEVAEALGDDNIFVLSDNPKGGTAFAAFESLCVPELLKKNPLLIITMGDRIVPPSVFRNLLKNHLARDTEADLTFLSAEYEPPKNRGKGRVLRNENGQVIKIIEEKDILAENDIIKREALLGLTEGNCPLYCIRALKMYQLLQNFTNDNMQNQYYLTDLVESVSVSGGEIRTITTTVKDPDYDLLCSDVTRPMDLALIEGTLSSNLNLLIPEEVEIQKAANAISSDRPTGQIASIASQLEDLMAMVRKKRLLFDPDKPVGIGISGGRLRIAFMHPDMSRFYGPAWQMPIGAADENGKEQILIIIQEANDHRIHLIPKNKEYRESVDSISSDEGSMYPGEEISDMNTYEKFGTRMSQGLLQSLGYFSDEELEERRRKNQPLPPASLRVSNNMRRPFTLIGNAIASLRTLRTGNIGAKVQEFLGMDKFKGLWLVSAGNIPQGGFSSSSAVTVATKNAINALFKIGISPDLLVHLACQAEYGTGVRAGSLDQATEQKGQSGKGTLISSNPKDNYKILGTFPIPYNRIQIIFPYTVERDRSAWQYSCGTYAENAGKDRLTTMEIRKMTGKAAEIAAILVRLPLETDFFKLIETDLIEDGLLSPENSAAISDILRQIPLLIRQEDLKKKVFANRGWYIEQLMALNGLDEVVAGQKADNTFNALFEGWHDPILKRTEITGEIIEEEGVPLRAILVYLFAEVAKNFYLVYHPDEWIEYVSLSQRGDCCFDILPERLPSREELMSEQEWERGLNEVRKLDLWMEKCGATPFNFNQELDDESLKDKNPVEFHRLKGSNFFRGLALIDLAEAMLKRAFGNDAVAVRVNAAGQGDYFQVHIDKTKADPNEVKQFLRLAFYNRFNINPPAQDFVEIHPGGGAVGVRIDRYEDLPQLIHLLQNSSRHQFKGTSM
jgi:hypothetical protein